MAQYAYSIICIINTIVVYVYVLLLIVGGLWTVTSLNEFPYVEWKNKCFKLIMPLLHIG
jgi:hypothetical protein